MRCSVCGADNLEGSIYCEDCGARLPAASAAAAPVTQEASAVHPVAAPVATPVAAPIPPVPTPVAAAPVPEVVAGANQNCGGCGAINPPLPPSSPSSAASPSCWRCWACCGHWCKCCSS